MGPILDSLVSVLVVVDMVTSRRGRGQHNLVQNAADVVAGEPLSRFFGCLERRGISS